jgi:hypothetical protein
VHAFADVPTELEIELRVAGSGKNYTPEKVLENKNVLLQKGRNCLQLTWSVVFEQPQYAYLVFHKNDNVKLAVSQQRITGILSLFNTINKAVSNFGRQNPPDGIGVDSFEFWVPKRRPAGENIALKLHPSLPVFPVENIRNGVARPTNAPNAWIAAWADRKPFIQLQWKEKQQIKRIELSFDTDFDHPMETVLMTHPERIMPFCVRDYSVVDESGVVVYKKEGNHQTRNSIVFDEPIQTKSITLHLQHPSENVPVAVFEIRCYRE